MSIIPNYVPRQYKTVNVVLAVKSAERALEFYNRAFGAEVENCLRGPDGKVVHAEIKIADTLILLTEEDRDHADSSVSILLYTGDAEALFDDALRAGAREVYPITKKIYGDRSGKIQDPFGHYWVISTHMEDLTAIELQHRFNHLSP